MAKRVNMIPIFTHISYLPYVQEAKWGYVRILPFTIRNKSNGFSWTDLVFAGPVMDEIIEAGTTQYNPQGYGLYKK